ncbi:MAG: molybdenum cofactor biosynthesis protein MoaE [Anaerolineales bacterium]|nr:MAG: molybdenum cofactor biosynthesis protein MoaE [Anaerolineales bacterium]
MGQHLYRITDTPISGQSIVDDLIKPEIGAVVTFVGVVRGATDGRAVQYLDYEAYPEMAENVLAQIGDEVHQKWSDVEDIAIVHRIGHLVIGDTAVVIALSAAHRRQLFDALHYTIDRIKIIAPIWKKEVWSDGTGEWKSEL